MRILLTADPIIPVPPIGYGGIERIVDALVREYKARGHTVGLVAQLGSTSPAHQTFVWPGHSVSRVDHTLRNALALAATARTFKPDIVHSFSRLIYLAPLLLRSVPKIMSYQRHTGGRQLAWAARCAGENLRFTGCSEFICSMGRRAGGEWRAIPNFVELEKFTFSSEVPPDAPLVFLSRVESIKGPDTAIEIARRAGRRLIIAGNHATSGPERKFWDEQIAPNIGRDGIEYVGEVNDEQKRILLASAAALIVPIRWDEPFGIVFAEALAAGTPIISCARGALPEIVSPGQTGYFIDSVEAGVQAVRAIATLDRSACREVATRRFSREVCATQYLDLYARSLQP